MTASSPLRLKVGIQALGQPADLFEGTLFKDKISPTDSQKRYEYYSDKDFNVTFNIYFGSLTAVIKTPQGEVIYNETLSGYKVFEISDVDVIRTNIFDNEDDSIKFTI